MFLHHITAGPKFVVCDGMLIPRAGDKYESAYSLKPLTLLSQASRSCPALGDTVLTTTYSDAYVSSKRYETNTIR
jgi:hypothetical protein